MLFRAKSTVKPSFHGSGTLNDARAAHCATDLYRGFEDVNGLPLGELKRKLFWVLESHCYDFLQVPDLGFLFWVSRDIAKTTVKHLLERKALHMNLVACVATGTWITRNTEFNAHLILCWCRSLTKLTAQGYGDGKSNRGYPFQKAAKYLIALIRANRNTLRFVNAHALLNASDHVFTTLIDCKHITNTELEIELPRVDEECMQPLCMPSLRKLALRKYEDAECYPDRRDPPFSRQAIKILSPGTNNAQFPCLTCLTRGCVQTCCLRNYISAMQAATCSLVCCIHNSRCFDHSRSMNLTNSTICCLLFWARFQALRASS